MNVRTLGLVGALSCLPCALYAQELPRVGFEEKFDSAEGWRVAGGAPIKAMTAQDGAVRFETVCGALDVNMKRPDWPEWPMPPFEPNTTLRRDYDLTLDLSVYRYVVVKLDERGTAVTLSVAGRPTPVCYTTGLRAYDLADRGFGGRKKITLSLELLNSSGCATFDFIRLVRELTDEEKAVLMAPSVEFFQENRAAHPYHRLEALNARSGRPRRSECEGQLAVYRDTLSNGVVWKLTDQPGDQAFRSGDATRGWSRDGRYFAVTGGRDGKNVREAAAGRWRETLGSGKLSDKPVPAYAASWESEVTPEVIYGYRTNWHRPDVDFIFYRFDRATGEEKEFARFTTEGKWDVRELARGEGDKAAGGRRGNFHVWIIDPLAKDPKDVLRYVKLPTRLKGLGFIEHDAKLVWFNCYTYEQLQMDLATGKVSLGYYTSGGHAGSGGGWTLRHYADMTVIQPDGLVDWRAGDKVKVFAHFKKPLDTDYGQLVDGARWWLTNGTGGDVRNQHIMVDGKDCATVLRLCGYNSSRNDWATNTYSVCSPDATKVAWVSDQLGDGDVMVVVARKPDPPRIGPTLTLLPGSFRAISWEAPERSKETAGYVVYGAGDDGIYRPISGLVAKSPWSGTLPKGVTRFLIVAREWSGLESLPSRAHGAGPDTLHLNVWQGERSRTARVVFDGTAAGTRCVRFFKASADEKDEPTVTWTSIDLPEGKTRLFMRSKPDFDGVWTWKELARGFELGKGSVKVTIPEEGLVDKVIVTNDPAYTPKTLDDRFPAPAPVEGAKAAVAADGLVTLTWAKPAALDFSHVEIFTGTDAGFTCENRTALGAVTAAQEPRFFDWGLKPGAKVFYKLVAVSGQDTRSEPVVIPADIPAAPQAVCLEIGTAKAVTKGKVEKKDILDEAMLAPWPVKGTDKPDPAAFVSVALPFDVPVDGTYSIWVRYAPGYTDRLGVTTALDGAEGTWPVRPPYRLMSVMFGRGRGQPKVWTDRLRIGASDVFDLKAGAHTLEFRLDPAIPDDQVHAIAKIWVTNDPSFRPDGWDPRADFRK